MASSILYSVFHLEHFPITICVPYLNATYLYIMTKVLNEHHWLKLYPGTVFVVILLSLSTEPMGWVQDDEHQPATHMNPRNEADINTLVCRFDY